MKKSTESFLVSALFLLLGIIFYLIDQVVPSILAISLSILFNIRAVLLFYIKKSEKKTVDKNA